MKHRVLLLGLGFWGSIWLDIIMSSDICEFAGASGSPAEIDMAVKKHGLDRDRFYTDYTKAIEESEADIAIIVIPAALHVDAAIMALDKGINIIMEKPLALTMSDAVTLLNKKLSLKGPNLMLSQNYRWRPHNQAIKNAINEGMLGKIETISYEFRKQEDLQGYRAGLQMPLLQDVSIHHFDLIRFFTGSDCDKIYCSTYRPGWSEFEGLPNTEALINMKNGVRVNYCGTWAARGAESSWDGNISITGEKGCIKLRADNSVTFYPHTKNSSVSFAAGIQKGVAVEQPHMRKTEMEYGLYMFIDCIEQGLTPETTIEDNIKSFAMVSAGAESIKRGAPVMCG